MPFKSDGDKRNYNRNRRREQTEDRQEIGLPPERENPKRWNKALADFRFFCEEYFRDKNDSDSTFSLDWSEDHLEVLRIVQEVVEGSLQLALAMARGSGKTAIFIAAVLWAILTGRRKFAVLVAATGSKAQGILRRIKRILTQNQKLIADFSHELHGVVALENESRRCAGQKIDGEPTGIEWVNDRIVFPTCPGSKSSGSVIVVAGIMGAIEGLQHIPMSGTQTIRPDLVLVDDPQTRASAKSPIQSAARLEVLNSAVANLGGPKRGVSILLAGTKMRPGDLMEQVLDTERNPEWGGRVFRAVYHFPDDMELWDRYYQTRLSKGAKKATEFYKKSRAAMDAGAKVYWPERFHPEKHEISGLQHFMNWFYKDRKVFWSEYQNDPRSEGALVFHVAERSQVESLCIDQYEGIAQNSASWIVAHFDIHKKIIYFTASAISRDFTFRKIMHGTYPDQRQVFFTQADCPIPLPDAASDVALYDALAVLVKQFAEHRWRTEDGRVMRTNLVTIDQQWKRAIVHRIVKENPYPNFVMPYRGMGIMAKNKPLADYDKNRNKGIDGRFGAMREMCYEDMKQTYNGQPVILGADVNALKTFFHDRLKVPGGMSGSIAFCGKDARISSLDYNRFFIDHLYAEDPFQDEDQATGRQKTIWRNDEKKQNHWLDCILANIAVGELLGASVGFQTHFEVKATGAPARKTRPRKRGIRQTKR